MFQLNLIFLFEESVIFKKRDNIIQIPLISRLWILLKDSESIVEYLFLS